MKKILKILMLFIIVIFIIAFVVMMTRYAYTPSYDKSENMTKEDIQQILNRRLTVDNIYLKNIRYDKLGEVDNLVIYSEYFIKGNMAKIIETTENGKRKIYQENRDIGEVIWIFETKDTVLRFQNEMNVFNLIMGYDYKDLDADVFAFGNYTSFKYLGKTNLNNRDVVAILLERNDMVREIIYIDEETGLILKHITKHPLVQYTSEAVLKVGSVTDDDVKFIDYEKEYPSFQVGDIK